MSEYLLATIIFGLAGLAVIPLVAAARSVELWIDRRRSERTPAE